MRVVECEKTELNVWGCNWITLQLGGNKYRGCGLGSRLSTLLCKKKITIAKPNEVETGCNLAQHFNEGCGSKKLF
jgi:hypothetical protein